MTEQPKVSIITPVYNASKYIVLTMDSVLAQSYDNWEMVMVDDCSSDNSVNIVKSYQAKDSRFRLIELEENSGSGIARNTAIKAAEGRIIAFLDSDDIWHQDKLKLHVQFMLDNDAPFSHTSYGYIDEKGEKIKSTFHVSKKPVTYKMGLKRTEISCLTAMYDTQYVGKRYMSTHRRKQDYALWLDILKNGFHSIPLDKELAYYRQHSGSATSNKTTLIKKHFLFLREQEKLNLFQSLYYTSWWMLNGFIRYYLK
jgi:teichuronic acid biosynthesis glycosyltransferase TuaG